MIEGRSDQEWIGSEGSLITGVIDGLASGPVDMIRKCSECGG